MHNAQGPLYFSADPIIVGMRVEGDGGKFRSRANILNSRHRVLRLK